MKKPVSQQYTQLTLDFEYEASTTAPAVIAAPKASVTAPVPAAAPVTATAPAKPSYHFTQADFEESQAIEHDIMYGRGAYLYKQIERDLAFQRESAKILKQFEAMRASIYQ